MKTKRINKDELIRRLKREIEALGTQGAFAKAKAVSPTIISEVLMGRREPSKKLLAAMNLRRVVLFETNCYEEK